jgi:hypothetical protein
LWDSEEAMENNFFPKWATLFLPEEVLENQMKNAHV